ncbi:MAG: endoglucanase, partial [Clostridiales bacterium]|nr:endoglucanase [Clostridiales bacterium]
LSTDPNDWSHYINSWNLDLLEINGKDYANAWVAQHQIAPSSDGYWYVHYKGNVSSAHIEIK